MHLGISCLSLTQNMPRVALAHYTPWTNSDDSGAQNAASMLRFLIDIYKEGKLKARITEFIVLQNSEALLVPVQHYFHRSSGYELSNCIWQ